MMCRGDSTPHLGATRAPRRTDAVAMQQPLALVTHRCRLLVVRLATAVGLSAMFVFPTQSSAQTAAAATATPTAKSTATATATTAATAAPGLQCAGTVFRNDPPDPKDPLKGQKDPFKGPLASPNLPADLLPIDDTVRESILDLVCRVKKMRLTSGQEDVGAWTTCSAASISIPGGRLLR